MKSRKKIRLGVNIDHIATLRQVRGGTTNYPDLLRLTRQAVRGGAQQITIHLREDRRHIQLADVAQLTKVRPVMINLEMAATPEMIRIALKHKPDWVCLVPEKRAELTTEGGLDVVKMKRKLIPMIERLQRLGIQISLFIEPSLEQTRAAHEVGADAVEYHTGKWVLLRGQRKIKEWRRLQSAANLAHSLDLSVHAGHGLDYAHAAMVSSLPYLREVNIGHSLVCYALENGLFRSVKKMRSMLK